MNSDELDVKPFYIWEGIYPDFQSAMLDAKGVGFSSDVYRNRSLAAANECLDALKSNSPIPTFHKQRSTYLPITVAMMLGGNKQVNILDFGGGLGIGYMTLSECLPVELKRVSYTIVEVPEVTKIGTDLHDGRSVIYTQNIPIGRKFDLVHAASSFQYIENWKNLIRKFSNLNPEFILLSDVFAGSIKTYVTLQNYYESKIPHWFLDLTELLDTFDRFGFRLIMKSYATSRRLDKEDTLPMDNFPADMRLTQSLHLLLQKKE